MHRYMKIVKKINNNVAIGIDGNGREVVAFGKGIGFKEMPYVLIDLNQIESTFYNVDEKYISLIKDIDEQVFIYVSKMFNIAVNKLDVDLNPNLLFTLADHFNFAITRYKNSMSISLPFSYELEHEYPEISKVARWMIKNVNKHFGVELSRDEVTSITSHFVNAMKGTDLSNTNEKNDVRITKRIIYIIEDFYGIKLDKSSFNYYRFENHLKYLIKRKEKNEEWKGSNVKLFDEMKNTYPKTYECIVKIEQYLNEEFGKKSTEEELLYLMLYVNRFCSQEKA